VRCGVLGDPIDHSLSPALHRAAYAEWGLHWEYDAHRVPAGGLGGFVDRLGPDWRGLSVTAPLKREAAVRADVVSPTVALAGVANTLVHEGGGWHADNTDISGAAAALRERWSSEIGAATILGGGATAASAGLALAGLGAASIRLLVREPSRAAEAVAAIIRHPDSPTVDVFSLHDGEVVGDVVVSTIPATAQTADVVDRCAGPPVVFEIVYHPWPTPLAQSVLKGPTDRVLVTGLDLLVHQAALQFEQFTSRPASLEAMRAALPSSRAR
jgi:shikimate dehydrogenase